MGELRSYQRNAIASVFRYYQNEGNGNILICAPTGSGKSHILGGFIQEVYKRFPEEKILVLTHTKEIIQQDVTIISQYVPRELVGIYSVGLKARQVKPYTVASIQSVFRKACLFQDFSLIVVDEAHLIPPSGEGRYRTFFSELPHIKIIGLTATPFRRSHGMLTEGHIFDKIVYDIPVQFLINQGYLVALSTKATEYTMNVKGLKVIAGDYSRKDLSDRLDRENVVDYITTELLKFKELKKSWLIFAIDIANCERIAKMLNEKGIVAAAVHSRLDIDRKDLLDLFKAGHVQALVAVETLTTGFDAPNIDMLVLMRPTQSPVLYVQMLGRGMRTYPNKDVCLVLDFAGNVSRLGPIDDIQLNISNKKKKGKKNNKGFMRVCPKCQEIVHINVKICPCCGYVFPVKEKLKIEADNAAILKSQRQYKIEEMDVTAMTVFRHNKSGGIPSLKVTYIKTPLKYFTEWVPIEHKGFPRHKAERWWRNMTGSYNVPQTVEEALARKSEIRMPNSIRINVSGKYPEIIGRF